MNKSAEQKGIQDQRHPSGHGMRFFRKPGLKSIRTRILVLSAMAMTALFIAFLVNTILHNRISNSEKKAVTGSDISQTMNRIIAYEEHYLHQPAESVLDSIERNNQRIWNLISNLGAMDNSGNIADGLQDLDKALTRNTASFDKVSKIVSRINELQNDLVFQCQNFNDYLSRIIRSNTLDETSLIVSGQYQDEAKKELGNVLKELLGYHASATLNTTNLLLSNNEEAFIKDEERLSRNTHLLLQAGSALSSITNEPADTQTWQSLMTLLGRIDRIREKLYESWKQREQSARELDPAGERVILAANNINRIAHAEYKELVKMRFSMDLLIILSFGTMVFFTAYLLSRSLLRSLEKLHRGAMAFANGDLDHRTLIETSDELGELSKAFDAMAENLSISYRNLEHEIEQKEMVKESLVASEKRYRDLFEHIQDPLIIVDLESHKIESVNQVAAMTFGYTQEEFTGKNITELVKDEEPARMKGDVEGFADGKVSSRQIYSRTYTRSDGTFFPAEVTVSPVNIDGKKKLVASIRDVTERQELESNLQQLEKLESLGIMAGGIAHDFNNILLGIMGHAGMAMLKLPRRSPARESVLGIETAAVRLKELTDQLLAYSGKGKFESNVIDLTGIVREMGSLLETVIPKEIDVRYDLDHEKLLIKGDSSQVCQVVMNLITNAAEASHKTKGDVLVNAGKKHFDRNYLAQSFVGASLEAGEYVYFRVSDKGQGIEKTDIPKIFDPFFTTKDRGRGLGLAAVIGIVKSHNGALIVESEPGKGSSFSVLFPIPTETADSVEKTDAADTGSRLDLKVLLVDDEEIVQEVASAMLEHAGITVTVACNGKQALEMFNSASGTFDLILLDLSMPVMNGQETFARLREIDPDIPVIFTSGYDQADSLTGMDSENFGFIKKPYSPRDLIAKIREAVEK